MKKRWQKYSDQMAELTTMIDEFHEGIATDPRLKKAFKKIVDKWGQVVSIHNEIDHLVDPIEPTTIVLPFESSEFSEIWSVYKKYMIETHNYLIKSYQESIMLNRLKRLSENNAPRATMMLELFISNGYKSIFKPSEKQLTGDEPAKTEDQQSTIDLTKKQSIWKNII